MDELKFERNFARDTKTFRCPVKRKDVERSFRRGVLDHQQKYIQEAAMWRWQHDTREFLIPRELVPFLPKLYLVRDVLAAVTTLWYIQKPTDRKIYTTLRELAEMIKVPANGKNLSDIQTALAFLRAFTIYNQEIITKLDRAGRKKEAKSLTWGFVSCIAAETVRNGRKLLKNQRRMIICISEPYAALLDLLPPATIPLKWLEASKRLPRRQVAHARNLVYRLAAEKRNPTALRESTLAAIADFRGDKNESQRAVRNLLHALAGLGVLDYQTRKNSQGETVYVIRVKKPKPNKARPNSGEACDPIA